MTVIEAAATVAPGRRRRAGAWVVIAVVIVVGGIAAAVIAGLVQWNKHDLLDPDSTGANGARALAHVLSTHGVHVEVARTGDEVDRALAEAGRRGGQHAHATLVLPDSPLLTDKHFSSLSGAAEDVVIMQPLARGMRLTFDARPAGFGADAPVAPQCAVDAAVRAGAILPATLYTLSAQPDVQTCYRSGQDVALLQRTLAGSRITAIDGSELFTNATLTQNGNAALAVNLLGAHDTLIWFVPRNADPGIQPPTLGELTPSWVSPVIVLLLVAGIAAAIWRGRRFGPLVAENLPVTVRAIETTDGRARLYARSRDVAHVAGRLRAGALVRLARAHGLGRTTDAGAVSDAVADLLGMPRIQVRAILIDDVPHTERDLLDLSDRLGALERAAQAALRPDSSSTDTGRTPS
ncbi:DUF4350 domain-containing protein [Microbacterium terrisoli]|uniref:DUF4350 domain-containing protein n=1 Tax=Microbacterium terrisoli TaxID=3242192 RepID=UPI0028051FE0|nr:DUF4350 domain-containing protein [Microbacterium protaetiae]